MTTVADCLVDVGETTAAATLAADAMHLQIVVAKLLLQTTAVQTLAILVAARSFSTAEFAVEFKACVPVSAECSLVADAASLHQAVDVVAKRQLLTVQP